MIEVQVGELVAAAAGAVVRPVASDFSPVTPATRRLDEAAGDRVREQCAQLGELPLGSAAITAAGAIEADFMVHVAVRSPSENPTAAVVRTGMLNALRRIADWQVDTVVVPPLGMGAGNLDAEESAEAMIPVIVAHMREGSAPSRVTVLVEDAYQEAAFAAAIARHTGS